MSTTLITSRIEARAAGAKRYCTGLPCKRGHVAERMTGDGACLECHRLKMRDLYPSGTPAPQLKWRKANPKKVKALRKASYDRNKAKQNKQSREWAVANADRVRELARVRRSVDPMPSRLYALDRKARKLAAEGTHTAADIQWLRTKQKNRCAHSWCRCDLTAGFHVDHVLPLILGGANGRRNLQLLCPPCNMRKQAIHPIDFAQRHGLLL